MRGPLLLFPLTADCRRSPMIIHPDDHVNPLLQIIMIIVDNQTS